MGSTALVIVEVVFAPISRAHGFFVFGWENDGGVTIEISVQRLGNSARLKAIWEALG